MADMNVTYSELKDAASKLLQGQSDIEAKLTELSTLVDHLTSSGFVTDHASGAFHDTFSTLQSNLKQAVDAYQGMASFLNGAAQAIEETDTQLASSIHAS